MYIKNKRYNIDFKVCSPFQHFCKLKDLYFESSYFSCTDRGTNFFRNYKLRFIHLRRTNLIGSVISKQEALQSNRWSTKKTNNKPSFIEYIDPKEIEIELNETEDYYRMFDKNLQNRLVKDIWYEDFTKQLEKEMDEVCDLLNVDRLNDYQSRLKMQARRSLEDRVGNAKEIVSYFK